LDLGFIVFPLLVLVLFYLIFLLPLQLRTRKQKKELQQLAVGDEIVTIGGIIARVKSIGEAHITLEVADGVEVRVLKSAIAERRRPAGSESETPLTADEP